ncbi:hypothetical protein E2C01_027205 [Portunus trituberculatus]|uniref:Uncharacterized protein n=1 Tax=Portunus trituberculatus TaxID=210409 RepID=A0A5B7EL16_PORTR|nr:hypothetical protein [Portunus trituberculatus]
MEHPTGFSLRLDALPGEADLNIREVGEYLRLVGIIVTIVIIIIIIFIIIIIIIIIITTKATCVQ